MLADEGAKTGSARTRRRARARRAGAAHRADTEKPEDPEEELWQQLVKEEEDLEILEDNQEPSLDEQECLEEQEKEFGGLDGQELTSEELQECLEVQPEEVLVGWDGLELTSEDLHLRGDGLKRRVADFRATLSSRSSASVSLTSSSSSSSSQGPLVKLTAKAKSVVKAKPYARARLLPKKTAKDEIFSSEEEEERAKR